MPVPTCLDAFCITTKVTMDSLGSNSSRSRITVTTFPLMLSMHRFPLLVLATLARYCSRWTLMTELRLFRNRPTSTYLKGVTLSIVAAPAQSGPLLCTGSAMFALPFRPFLPCITAMSSFPPSAATPVVVRLISGVRLLLRPKCLAHLCIWASGASLPAAICV